jgi:hypothetical protein
MISLRGKGGDGRSRDHPTYGQVVAMPYATITPSSLLAGMAAPCIEQE